MSRILIAFIVSTVGTLGPPPQSIQAQRRDAVRSGDTVRLSIEEAMTRALREGDETLIAREQVALADAQVATARSAGLPQLRMTAGYTQTLENARAAIVGRAIFGQNFTYTTNANLSQTIFQGGRIFAGSRAASDFRGAARATRTETEARVSVDVQRAYLLAILARELLDIQRRSAALADARLAQMIQLEQAGRAARYDVLRTRVERANLEPALLLARSNVELADIAVRRLLNLPSDATLRLVSVLDTARLRSVARAVFTETNTTSGDQRGSLRAAQMTVDARREGIRVARADFFPTISTFIQSGYTALPTTNGLPTKGGIASSTFCPTGSSASAVCQNNGWFPDRSFGVQVAWNIFDGLRTKGNLDLAQAQTRIAELQLTAERERVGAERAVGRAEFERAEAAFDAQRQNAAEADEAFRIATLRFDRGLSTLLEVTDAQNALLTAQVNAARASIEYYLAAAELARASGARVPLPPVLPSTP